MSVPGSSDTPTEVSEPEPQAGETAAVTASSPVASKGALSPAPTVPDPSPRDGAVYPPETGSGSLTSSSGGSSVTREAAELAKLLRGSTWRGLNASEILDSLVAALVAATARAERLQETNAALSRSAIANRDGRWAAEARAAELEAALNDLASSVDAVCESDATSGTLEPHARSVLELSLGRARHVLAEGAGTRTDSQAQDLGGAGGASSTEVLP